MKKYTVDTTTKFKKQVRKVLKQGKDIKKLEELVIKLSNREELDTKYKDHALIDNKVYKNMRECHIEPDWLLIYQIKDSELILLLFATGSHSELFE